MPQRFRVFHDPGGLPAALRGAAVAIGNFDGVHCGHQHVFAQLRRRALRLGVPAIAMTFEPHPRQFFARGEPLLRLGSAQSKARLMRAVGLDGMIVLTFDESLSRIDREAFVDRFLVGTISASAVVVGSNFRFGRGRLGDIGYLVERGRACGFEVETAELLEKDGAPVSSTRVRSAIAAGDFALARDLLGYHWFTEAVEVSPVGDVRRGDGTELRVRTPWPLASGRCRFRGQYGPWPIEGTMSPRGDAVDLVVSWSDHMAAALGEVALVPLPASRHTSRTQLDARIGLM